MEEYQRRPRRFRSTAPPSERKIRKDRPQDQLPPEAELRLLAKRYDSLNEANDGNIKTIKSLLTRIGELETANKRLNDQHSELKLAYDSIKNENGLLHSQLDAYPKRIQKLKPFKVLIMHQKKYISYLKGLLAYNGIEFEERKCQSPSAHELELMSDEDLLKVGQVKYD